MDQVTFTDVLQKSFIAMSMGSTDRITTLNILINISMSFCIGMFIFFIYKKTYQGVYISAVLIFRWYWHVLLPP